jgi:hypothetical protein
MCRAVLSLVTWWILAAPALAQWSPDPTLNNPVAVAPDGQTPVLAVSDGAGGAVFVWRSERVNISTLEFFYDLRAQRLSATGVPLWAPGGVVLTVDWVAPQSTLLRPPFSIVTDGTGGVIAAWRDNRNSATDSGDIFARRVDGTGAVLWTADGLPVTLAPDLQQKPVIVADGAGGAIIAWEDRRNGFGNVDVFAQRVDASGAVQWAADGIPVSAAAGDQLLPVITTDGAGGAVLAWTDGRGPDPEIFAQKILAAGTAAWTADGVALTTATPGIQTRPVIATDTLGGAFVAWEDGRFAADNDVYARLVSSDGTPQWAVNGVSIAATANATFPLVVADLLGGAFVVWTDERSGASDNNVFAQRVNAGGVVQWAANGVAVCDAANGQFFPAATADGAGGVLIGWEDGRTDAGDIYAQRLDVSGAAMWPANGRPVSTAANAQGGTTVAPDGTGGGIYAWADGRAAATGVDVYAAHVDSDGGLPVALESFTIQ